MGPRPVTIYPLCVRRLVSGWCSRVVCSSPSWPHRARRVSLHTMPVNSPPPQAQTVCAPLEHTPGRVGVPCLIHKTGVAYLRPTASLVLDRRSLVAYGLTASLDLDRRSLYGLTASYILDGRSLIYTALRPPIYIDRRSLYTASRPPIY